MNQELIRRFIDAKMMSGSGHVPARLQACLALLERLRTFPSLELGVHLATSGQSLISHESLGNSGHARLNLDIINKNHGRRSSNIQDWGQDLLDILREIGFEQLDAPSRTSLLDSMQASVADTIRAILDKDPIVVRTKGRSSVAVIADALDQADRKGRGAAVAQYLVGAKLMLRFPALRDRILILPANKGDRKSRNDHAQRRGDFDLGEYVFEVTVAAPDAKHLDQLTSVLEDSDAEIWLLVRDDRLQFWKDELKRAQIDSRRVVVASVEQFVGQNVAELGELTAKGKSRQLDELFNVYNEEWIAEVGSQGMKIMIK